MDEAKRRSEPVRVASVERVAGDAVVMAIEAPAMAAAAQPGQFVMVRFPGRTDPLLPRPLSIHDVDGGAVLLLIRTVGRTTRALAEAPPGTLLHATGPLGRGFQVPAGRVRHILVGGGMGVAPLPLLIRRLRAVPGAEVRVLVGARTPDGLYALERLAPASRTTIVEQGTGGRMGLATDLLAEALSADEAPKAVYACGPEAMLAAVARMCIDVGTPCQVSLEAIMACGTGLCHGCAIRLGGAGGYARVCVDGPVFDASRLAIPWSR